MPFWRMEIIGAFLADASQIHGDVAVGTTIPYKLVPLLYIPLYQNFNFLFDECKIEKSTTHSIFLLPL